MAATTDHAPEKGRTRTKPSARHTTPDLTTGRTSPDLVSGRTRILQSAAQLFLTRGYAETSLRTIGEDVGMRPASIYHHFASKDALLTEILEIGMAAVTEAFDDAARSLSPEASGQTQLERHVAGHLSALFAHHTFTAAHVTVFPFVPPDVRATSVPERDAYEARWTALLCSIAPRLDDQGVRLTRLSLFGAMNSTVQWFDPSNGSTNELAVAIVATTWNGLATVGGGT